MRHASAAAHKNLCEDSQTIMPVSDVNMHRVCYRNYDLHQPAGLAGLHLSLHASVPKLVLGVQDQL